MIIKKTFEQWLQQFDSRLHIEEIDNDDIEVLYWGDARICSIPKGLKKSKSWTDIMNDKRDDSGYTTSDGIQHRSISGIGLMLMVRKLITTEQFIEHFTSSRNKDLVERVLNEKQNVFG